MAGPYSGGRPPGTGERFGSPQWSDNVGRMHAFMRKHPEVIITTPMQNGTDDFIAAWPDDEVRDRSLGWLMDNLEERFAGPVT